MWTLTLVNGDLDTSLVIASHFAFATVPSPDYCQALHSVTLGLEQIIRLSTASFGFCSLRSSDAGKDEFPQGPQPRQGPLLIPLKLLMHLFTCLLVFFNVDRSLPTY
jgi:hypothetical protein